VSVALRTLARAALLLTVAACAQMDPPPGGPEDRSPPYVVGQRPDSLAVVPGWSRPVVIQFSERISEQQVEESVMVSPRTSPVAVDRGSREIRVSLRRGWEAGQIYQVTIRPLVQDLFSNRITEQVQVVFSTGPAIPDTRLAGVVRDRISGEPVMDARVEAIRGVDSLVYAVPTDSAGGFELVHLPEGAYLLRAFPDANRNRSLDVTEQRDSALVAITSADTLAVELSVVAPDSTPPVIASVQVGREQRVEVRFDDYLDPAQEIDSTTVTIMGVDSLPLGVAEVMIGEPAAAVEDTAQAAAPPLPSRLLVVRLAEGVELTPEAEYSVAVADIRNVVGLSAAAAGEFTAPQPPEPPPSPEQEADTVLPPDPDPEAAPGL
jgi:hypothetical protein